MPTDNALPDPHVTGAFLLPGGSLQQFDNYNISAQVGEGNGYGTMNALNTYIRSIMRGENLSLTVSFFKHLISNALIA